MPKTLIIILSVLLLILLCGASFLFGLYVGKVKLSEQQVAAEKHNLISAISEKIKKFPGMEIFNALPPDIIHGQIKSISGDLIILTAAPSSVEDLFQAEKEYRVNVSDKTEIYYLELNAKTGSFEKKPLQFEQLKPNETISVTFDPIKKFDFTVEALKIKTNR